MHFPSVGGKHVHNIVVIIGKSCPKLVDCIVNISVRLNEHGVHRHTEKFFYKLFGHNYIVARKQSMLQNTAHRYLAAFTVYGQRENISRLHAVQNI